jgi:hypothetical protein
VFPAEPDYLAPEGSNVRGQVTLIKSARLEPEVRVSSPYAGYQDNTVDRAGDWNDDTLFWIEGYPQPGVLAVWEFAEPIAVRTISLPSGALDGSKDKMVGGTLEVSEDGNTFFPIASFKDGTANAELPAGTQVRAIRVVATQTQKTWVMLRDPILR